MRKSLLAALASISLLALYGPALAQQLDAPALSVEQVSRVSVRLTITAGETGAPGGFVLEWMKRSDYEMYGWPQADIGMNTTAAAFEGSPTLNVTRGVKSFELGPNQSVAVEVGDLFDETGFEDLDPESEAAQELADSTEYVFRVHADAFDGLTPSNRSELIGAQTLQSLGCTYTQGYWKNHPSAWPVSSLKISGVTYTKAQLINIFNTPARGNGLLTLMHQLIAAKLNIAGGANAAPISSAIAAAEALIAGRVCPPVGSGSLSPGASSSLTNTLDNFNNGVTAIPHCGGGTTRTLIGTWGQLRHVYR